MVFPSWRFEFHCLVMLAWSNGVSLKLYWNCVLMVVWYIFMSMCSRACVCVIVSSVTVKKCSAGTPPLSRPYPSMTKREKHNEDIWHYTYDITHTEGYIYGRVSSLILDFCFLLWLAVVAMRLHCSFIDDLIVYFVTLWFAFKSQWRRYFITYHLLALSRCPCLCKSHSILFIIVVYSFSTTSPSTSFAVAMSVVVAIGVSCLVDINWRSTKVHRCTSLKLWSTNHVTLSSFLPSQISSSNCFLLIMSFLWHETIFNQSGLKDKKGQ